MALELSTELAEFNSVTNELEKRLNTLTLRVENVRHDIRNLDREANTLRSEVASVYPLSSIQDPDYAQKKPLQVLGTKKVTLACEKETRGTHLDMKKLRFFSGTFDLNYKGMLLPLRIVLIRLRQDGKSCWNPVALSVCFPSVTATKSRNCFYETMKMKISFLNKDNSALISKGFYIKPENGTCMMSNLSDREHWQCDSATYFDSDFFGVQEGLTEERMQLDEAILCMQFPHKNQQVFYIKTQVEVAMDNL